MIQASNRPVAPLVDPEAGHWPGTLDDSSHLDTGH
jgi:hypothetical protein